MLATGVVASIIGSFVYFSSIGGLWMTHQSGDLVSEAQKAERQKAFAAVGTLELTPIPSSGIIAAVDSMGLPPASRDALLASLTKQDLPATSSPASTAPTSAPPTTQTQGKAVPVEKKPENSPAPSTAKTTSLRLAWITLWDTDTQDGDVVRIDSQGYSRTITLSTQPVTIAIPVPAEGTLPITGIRDGEGGGITVGLASGQSRAVFPIMSVGQTLELRAKIR